MRSVYSAHSMGTSTVAVMNDILSLTVNSLPLQYRNPRQHPSCIHLRVLPDHLLVILWVWVEPDFGVSLIHIPFFVVTFSWVNLVSQPSGFNISEMSKKYLVFAVERSLAV